MANQRDNTTLPETASPADHPGSERERDEHRAAVSTRAWAAARNHADPRRKRSSPRSTEDRELAHMETSLQRLRNKLCRELAQAEHDALIHCEREARRYGAQAPGQALRDIADDAKQLRPRLAVLYQQQRRSGIRAGRFVAEVFSALRHFALDRVIDAERTYRATLLGVRHGLDVARLLREVLVQQHDYEALRVCDELLERRARLLTRAEDRLRWFAAHPRVALRPSHRALARNTEALRLRASSSRRAGTAP